VYLQANLPAKERSKDYRGLTNQSWNIKPCHIDTAIINAADILIQFWRTVDRESTNEQQAQVLRKVINVIDAHTTALEKQDEPAT
jgi:hypothetical protein